MKQSSRRIPERGDRVTIVSGMMSQYSGEVLEILGDRTEPPDICPKTGKPMWAGPWVRVRLDGFWLNHVDIEVNGVYSGSKKCAEYFKPLKDWIPDFIEPREFEIGCYPWSWMIWEDETANNHPFIGY